MSNKLYDTAQKLKAVYTDSTKEKEVLELNSLLNDEVSNLFENNQSEIIENTLTQIINENDGELLDIVLDEVNFEIENVLYEDDTDNKDYDSTMVLVPCVIMSQAEAISIPSIQSFEIILGKLFCLKILSNQKNSSILEPLDFLKVL